MFPHSPCILILKTIQERNAVINNYYSFIPGPRQATNVLNISRQAGKRFNQRKRSSTSLRTGKKINKP